MYFVYEVWGGCVFGCDVGKEYFCKVEVGGLGIVFLYYMIYIYCILFIYNGG